MAGSKRPQFVFAGVKVTPIVSPVGPKLARSDVARILRSPALEFRCIDHIGMPHQTPWSPDFAKGEWVGDPVYLEHLRDKLVWLESARLSRVILHDGSERTILRLNFAPHGFWDVREHLTTSHDAAAAAARAEAYWDAYNKGMSNVGRN
jgi:hypothetical protein